ncbi:MAG: hypothetical protein KAT27_00840 [Desulfobacterales bacterium]|nr:hypothetical protein [Desulfobacterales bacterium]
MGLLSPSSTPAPRTEEGHFKLRLYYLPAIRLPAPRSPGSYNAGHMAMAGRLPGTAIM